MPAPDWWQRSVHIAGKPGTGQTGPAPHTGLHGIWGTSSARTYLITLQVAGKAGLMATKCRPSSNRCIASSVLVSGCLSRAGSLARLTHGENCETSFWGGTSPGNRLNPHFRSNCVATSYHYNDIQPEVCMKLSTITSRYQGNLHAQFSVRGA